MAKQEKEMATTMAQARDKMETAELEAVRALKTSDTLVIVAWAPSSRDNAPRNDTFDYWACNELGMVMPHHKWTAHFQIHKRAHIRKFMTEASIEYLTNCDHAVFVEDPEDWPEVKTAVRFPFAAMLARYGEYWSSTIAWQLGLALELGYDTVHLYGVDMVLDSEYEFQRPCVEYLIGYMRGAGITVHVAEQAGILHSPWVYAVEIPPVGEGVINEEYLSRELQLLTSAENNAQNSAMMARGALNQLGALVNAFSANPASMTIEEIQKGIAVITKNEQEAVRQHLVHQGAKMAQENNLRRVRLRNREMGIPITDGSYRLKDATTNQQAREAREVEK